MRHHTKRRPTDIAPTIQWHFIPPYSPHIDGLWEAEIKSVKTHMRRVLGEALLTFEEMYMTQIEAVLNSQPLTPISNDPLDLRALIPGHFLIREPFNAIPQRDFIETPSNQLTRFQYLTKISDLLVTLVEGIFVESPVKIQMESRRSNVPYQGWDDGTLTR